MPFSDKPFSDSPFQNMSRRNALRLAASASAGSVLSLTGAGPGQSQTQAQAREAEVAAGDIPVTLTASPSRIRLRPEPFPETEVWQYDVNGGPPILRMTRGRTLAVTLVNRLPQATTLHVYGLRHENAVDGVAGLTEQPLPSGESRVYRFTPRDAGTYWFHPLVPGRTAEQVERGLSGMLIVDEAQPPEVDADLPVVLDDWRLTDEAVIIGNFGDRQDAARLGRLGNHISVNRQVPPSATKVRPGARVRLRFASVANARIMPMRFQGFQSATIIAIDGQPCEPFDPLRKQVVLAPGSRYDALVDLPVVAGSTATVSLALGNGIEVVRLTTEGEPQPIRPAVVPLSPNVLPPMIRLQDASRAELLITGGAAAEGERDPPVLEKRFPDARAIWTINGGRSTGLTGRPLLTVKRGAVCVIALTNRTAWHQVLHLHGHVFRLLHPLDDGWEPYFLDTLIVPDNRTMRIAFVADNPGRWLVRSSVLEHMESGVLTWYEVI